MAETKQVAGGAFFPSSSMVSADQTTIVGNGTTEDPLRAVAVTSLYQATYMMVDDDVPAVPGLPVVVDVTPPVFGVASVKSGSSGVGGAADVVAVIVRLVAGGVVLRSSGSVILTAVQWDVVTGLVGGLVPNVEYYLDIGGGLTATPPMSTGTSLSRVGIALSATALLLTTPSDPIAN